MSCRTSMKTAALAMVAMTLGGLVGALLIASAAGAAERSRVAGTITAVACTRISVQPEYGQPITVNIDDDTVVILDGQPATGCDLRVGMQAVVSGEHMSQGQPAVAIRATSQPPGYSMR